MPLADVRRRKAERLFRKPGLQMKASAASESAKKWPEDRFDDLKKKAAARQAFEAEDETKTNTPEVAWDVLVNYYKDKDNKPILESIMDATMLSAHA